LPIYEGTFVVSMWGTWILDQKYTQLKAFRNFPYPKVPLWLLDCPTRRTSLPEQIIECNWDWKTPSIYFLFWPEKTWSIEVRGQVFQNKKLARNCRKFLWNRKRMKVELSIAWAGRIREELLNYFEGGRTFGGIFNHRRNEPRRKGSGCKKQLFITWTTPK